MEFDELLTPKIRRDTNEMQATLNLLKQSLEEAQNNEKRLTDELNSTKTKLKNTESQLLHSPRWSPEQKLDSDIKFLNARHQTDIDELQGKIAEKDREIENLKKQMSTNSPDATSFISFVIKSIQQMIEKGTSKDQFELMRQLNTTLGSFQDLVSQPKSLKDLHESLKTYIQTIVKANVQLAKTANDTTEKDMIMKRATAVEQQMRDALSEIEEQNKQNKKLESTSQQLKERIKDLEKLNENNENTLYDISKKLSSDENASLDENLKRIEELLETEKENKEIKEIFADFAEKALGFHTIASLSSITVSKQIFDSVLAKLNNNELLMKEIAKVFGITPSPNILSDIQDKYSDLKDHQESSGKTHTQMIKMTNDLNDQLSKLQLQNSQKRQQINTLNDSFEKQKKKLAKAEEEKEELEKKNEELSKELFNDTKKFQKQINELKEKLEKANNAVEKHENNAQDLTIAYDAQKSDLEKLKKDLSDAKQNSRKLNRQNQKLQSENRNVSAELNQNKAFIEKLNDEVADLTQYKTKYFTLQQELQKQNEKFKKGTEKINFLTSENEKSRKLLDAFTQKITKHKKQIANLKAENKSMKNNAHQQSTEISAQSERYQNAINELAETSKELTKTKEDVKQLVNDINEREQQIVTLQNSNDLLKAQISNANRQIAKLDDTVKKYNSGNEEMQKKEVQNSLEIENLKSSLEKANNENVVLTERLKNQTTEMLALHESDVSGKIAKEELRTTKEKIEKLKESNEEKTKENERINQEISELKKENEEIKEKLSVFDEENKEIKDAINQRDLFISNIKDQKKESKLLKKALKETAGRLQASEKNLEQISNDYNELREQYTNDIKNLHKQISELTNENESLSEKTQDLKVKLASNKETLKTLSKASNEDKSLINELTEKVEEYKENSVKRSLFEQLQGKLRNAQQEIIELKSETSEKDATIAISSQKAKDFEEIQSRYNREHSILLQIKSQMQTINQNLRRMTLGDVIEKLQPVFEVFSITFESRVFKQNLSFKSLRPISIQEEGEVFTKRHQEVLIQIIGKLGQFPIEAAHANNPMSLIDRLKLISSLFDELKAQFVELESSNKRLQSIVQTQHAAICSMTKVSRSPAASPMKFNSSK